MDWQDLLKDKVTYERRWRDVTHHGFTCVVCSAQFCVSQIAVAREHAEAHIANGDHLITASKRGGEKC